MFNYLFDQKQFKKEAELTLSGQKIPFKVTFDKSGYGAVITSSKFKMFTNKDMVLNFTLPKIASADGSRKLKYEIYHSYTINKILEGKSFFVDNVRTFIANDNKGNPRNILAVTFSQPVNMADMVKYSGLFITNDEAESFLYSDKDVKSKVALTPVDTGTNADTVLSFYVDAYYDKNYGGDKSFYFAIKQNVNSVSGKLLNTGYKERIIFSNSCFLFNSVSSALSAKMGNLLTLPSFSSIPGISSPLKILRNNIIVSGAANLTASFIS